MKCGRSRVCRRRAVVAVLLGVGWSARLMAVEAGASGAASKAAKPEKYVLDYPPTEKFCPPVETFFFEVVRTFEVVRGRQFTHQPNGGYGLPVVRQVGGKNLLHLGADVGWHRAGAPVYAVAAGVVRVSDGPDFAAAKRKGDAAQKKGSATPNRRPETLSWGNRIIIEHRLPGGEYFTTVYGHLATKRVVEAGDVVEAGQQIGTIGRKHLYINGGFDPHVHFGVRQGRLAEPGCTLLYVRFRGRLQPLKLAAVTAEEIEIRVPAEIPVPSVLGAAEAYPVTVRDGKYFLPARMLWDFSSRPGFEIVGYGLSTDGWHNPTSFLRQHAADNNPAPFQGPKRATRLSGR